MRQVLPLLGLLLFAVPASADPPVTWSRYPAAREVQLRDVAAYVRVSPENRTDVAVSVINTGPLPSPRLSVSGRRLVVDGGLRGQIRSCRVGPENAFSVQARRQGRVEDGSLPTIEIRIPQDVVLTAGGATRIRLAPAQSAHVRIDGCGDADIERIEDDADLAVSGSPDVRLYDAGSVTVSIAGAGDVTVGAVRDGITASIAGSGDLRIAHAEGPASIAIQGSGDANIHDGRIGPLTVAILGSGDFAFGGSAQSLDAAVVGAGDVRVARVEGQVSRRVFGSGQVVVGH